MSQRSLFAEVNKDLKHFLCPFRLGMQHSAAGTTEYAEGIKTNWPIVVASGQLIPGNYDNLQLSKGGLKVPIITAATFLSNQLTVQWSYNAVNPCGKNNPDDIVVVVAAHRDSSGHFDMQAFSTTAARSEERASIVLPTDIDLTPGNYAVYAFAYNDTDASATSYHVGE